MSEGCVVCAGACLKQYKCPKCSAPYCGVACFRKHKEVCVPAPPPTASAPSTTYDEAVQRVDAAPTTSPMEDEGSDELEVLRGHHLSALANHPGIRGQLKTKELQKLVRIINNSRSRLDALDAALHNVPEFKEFADLVLSVVHSCNSRAA